MPNRWPVQNGNWSVPSTWSGSLIPNAADDVFLNNRVVTLDQNIQVISITNASSASAITAGGRIEIYDNFNISSSLIRCVSSTTPGMISFYGTESITITSQINQSAGSEAGICLHNLSTGTMNVIGNVHTPFNSGLGFQTGHINASTGILNIIGNVISSVFANGNSNTGIVNSLGTINITGNVLGAAGNVAGPTISNTGIGSINVTGNIIGTTPTQSGQAATLAISNTSVGVISVTGNVTAFTGSCISSTAAGTINVIGTVQSSTTANAILSTSTTATNIFSGPLINSGSRNAIYCYNVQMYKNATTSYRIGVSGSNDIITLLSEDQAPGMPITTNVRSGVIYGPTNALTGRMAVPDPRSVSWGVAVDNTTGSAIVKPEDIWNYTLTSLTSSNSIGQRLASTATSASNASIANAFSN